MARAKDDGAEGLLPWARRKGETPEAHRACLKYLNQPGGRSRPRLADEEGYSVKVLDRWAAQWDWTERARAFDSHVAHVEQVGRDEVIKARAREWEQRRETHLEEGWVLAQALRDRINEMLAHPIVAKKKDAKTGTVTIKPVRWNHGNLATLANLAIQMEKLVLDSALPTEEGPTEVKVSVDFDAALRKVYDDDGDEDPAREGVIR